MKPCRILRLSAWMLTAALAVDGLMAQDSDRMTVGVIEFRVENDIGLENAGRIIGEWLASELVRVGQFDVSERLSLEAVLAEQDLGLLGVIDDQSAAQVGKIHGVQGIITGSVMKIGNTISVTGRIIAVESGKVLKTSVVRASSLDNLPTEIEVMANALSDVSRAEFEIRRDITKRSQAYMAIGGGFTMAGSQTDGLEGSFGMGIAATVSYSNQNFSAWFDGTPIGGLRGIHTGFSVDLTPVWGVAAEVGLIADDMIDFVSVNYLLIGVKMQPRHELTFRLMFGGSTSGLIWLWDTDDVEGGKETVDGNFKFLPPGAFGVHALYRLKGGYTLMARLAIADLQDYSLKHGYDPLDGAYEINALIFSIQREFAVDF